ncbi:hypothetical protein V8E54_007722 [Elaphomyces granulatus]
MSYDMEKYAKNALIRVPTTNSAVISDQIDKALERLQIESSDEYDSVGILSLYYLIKFGGIMGKLSDQRRLLNFHYVGHAVRGSTSNRLELTPKIGDDEGTLDFSAVKDMITKNALRTAGLDVLYIMDCCCAAAGARGGSLGGRIEFMAATSPGGISNSREDGDTFTQDLSKSFVRLAAEKKHFTTFDLMDAINGLSGIEVLQEGWKLPVTFRPSNSILIKNLSISAKILDCTLIVAFHVIEGTSSQEFKHLVDHLEKVPVPVTIVAALPTSSTLLLLLMPSSLEHFLHVPRFVL